MMTKRQSYALLHPVRTAGDCPPGHRLRVDNRYQTTLACEFPSGEWRVAVAVVNSMSHPQPVAQWSDLHRRMVEKLLVRLLEGVGEGEDRVLVDVKEIVLHRSMTESERFAAAGPGRVAV